MKKGLNENMKKSALLSLAAVLLLGLAACAGGEGAAVTEIGGEDPIETLEVSGTPNGSENEEDDYFDSPHIWNPVREAPDFTKLTIVPDANSGESLEIPDMWVTEHGAYYVNVIYPEYSGMMRGGGVAVGTAGTSLSMNLVGGNDNKPITLVHIIDSATGKDMVLCNRVTCPHDSEDCGAYLPDDPVDPNAYDEWGFTPRRVGWGSSSTLFIDGGYIYALNSGTTFYRLGLDGSGRTEHMRLPEKYDFSWGRSWLMHGKLYTIGSFTVQMDEFNFGSATAMIEVDYVNRTTNVVWESEQNSYTDVLGLWDGQIYLVEFAYNSEWGQTQEEMLDYYNNQTTAFFSYNPITEQMTEIFKETGDGFNGNTWNIPESGEIIFHSRRDEALYRLNVRTGDVTLLTGNVSGFIFINEERDGRVLMIRYDNDDWMVNYQVSDTSLLFYEFATGEFGELTLRIKQSVGDDEIAYILFEENGYYYIEIERETTEVTDYGHTWFQTDRTLLGRIPIDDYWASNADAIEELDWYDQNEWWEFLDGVYGRGIARG
ncbi:MAG: hypothetical protein LBC86_07035 [Oscillospiraceae bacterium]|nr:hypothetical protein [Oscillospiraceae bacterium]